MDLELNSHDIGDMPIGGKDAFLSKVTFRCESKWYSKTKQMLKDMKSIEERAKEYADLCIVGDCSGLSGLIHSVAEKAFFAGGHEQKVIDNKRTEELLQYLEELEAHYRDLGQYDDGKPIRRVIEYIKSMEE